MTTNIILMFALLSVITLVMALEWLPVDLTALTGLILLVLSGLLTPQQAFSGFANDIIFILASLFVLSGALAKSGITHLFARLILKIIQNKNFLASGLMSIVACLSAFFSNTNATAMLIPVTLQVAKKAKVRASRLLMPLAYASILGGTCTLIGTSTNLASAGLVNRLGLPPFGLFEFIIPGFLMTVLGIAYLSLVGNRLIPRREQGDRTKDYQFRDYLAELNVNEDSTAIGDTIASLKLEPLGIVPLALLRENKKKTAHGNRKLQAGDIIIVKCPRDALLQLTDSKKLAIKTETAFSEQDLKSKNWSLSEVVLLPQSNLIGKNLQQLNFQQQHQVEVLAVYRRGHAYPTQIENLSFMIGDVLLLRGEKSQLAKLSALPELWVSQSTIKKPLTVKKGLYVLLAMIGAIILASLAILPPAIAFLAAVIAVVLSGCVSMEEAYASIEWRLLILIACMSSFGVAMQSSGTAEFLAEQIAGFTYPYGLSATLFAFAVLTILLTQPMSNAAAALVVLPVAIATAGQLNVNPITFAVMVTLSASLSFITPLEPASLLVYGAGKYRFLDFVKVGLPMTILTVIFLVWIIPRLWPF
jgi:di/tricarboxylate transporter